MAVNIIDNIVEMYKSFPRANESGESALRAYLVPREDSYKTPEQREALCIQMQALREVTSTATDVFANPDNIVRFLKATEGFPPTYERAA